MKITTILLLTLMCFGIMKAQSDSIFLNETIIELSKKSFFEERAERLYEADAIVSSPNTSLDDDHDSEFDSVLVEFWAHQFGLSTWITQELEDRIILSSGNNLIELMFDGDLLRAVSYTVFNAPEDPFCSFACAEPLITLNTTLKYHSLDGLRVVFKGIPSYTYSCQELMFTQEACSPSRFSNENKFVVSFIYSMRSSK